LIEISHDRTRMDVDVIHAFLSQESYWARNVPREVVERALEHSLCVGAFENGAQVGFARVITDYATFGYIADVFVLPSHRGRGIAKELMNAIMNHRELRGLRRWHLVTRDAHALYAQFGFTAVDVPERHMMKTRPSPYPLPAERGEGTRSE
jgi:GNAT superfamily N-acetyltransferase